MRDGRHSIQSESVLLTSMRLLPGGESDKERYVYVAFLFGGGSVRKGAPLWPLMGLGEIIDKTGDASLTRSPLVKSTGIGASGQLRAPN